MKQENAGRGFCRACRNPPPACYCTDIRPFDPKIRFAILTHKLEAKRRVASGRMSHLTLQGSDLWMGHDFSAHARVNAAIDDPRFHPVLLYPGESSQNLSRLAPADRAALLPSGKTWLVFVIDGTWSTARQSMRLSANLRALPRISFDVETPSRFRIREQPKRECYSSLEAIHRTIELLGPTAGVELSSPPPNPLPLPLPKNI